MTTASPVDSAAAAGSAAVAASAGAADATSTAPIVELEGLEVRLGRRPVLRGLTATLSGRAVGLLGPNGAGKTTLLHTLLGFHRPSAGRLRVLGLPVPGQVAALRALVGYMPESDSFIASLTAVRFVRLMAELSGLPPEAALERAHEALWFVGLGEARYRKIATYSLGMKQLVKLAQAIVHGPRLLLLDEPTNGLDPPARQRMIRLIRSIRDSGAARLLISSHLLRDVEECCDEVVVLKDGQVATVCDLASERRSNRRFIELEAHGDGAGFAAAAAALGCECALGDGRRMKLVLPAGVEVPDLYRLAAAHAVQIRRLSRKRDSLEEIFLKAMEGGNATPAAAPAPADPA